MSPGDRQQFAAASKCPRAGTQDELFTAQACKSRASPRKLANRASKQRNWLLEGAPQGELATRFARLSRLGLAPRFRSVLEAPGEDVENAAGRQACSLNS